MHRRRFAVAFVAVSVSGIGGSAIAEDTNLLVLAGTWSLTSAYEIRADGTRTTNYGEHPQGLLMIDRAGRYSLQIFRPGRPRFASGVKTSGTPEEYREAVLGSSTHTGHAAIDSAHHKLIFEIETASFPNWEGSEQIRDYTYEGDLLTYSVPSSASGNGTTAFSVWKRVRS